MDHVSKGLRISCGLAMLVSLIGYVLPWVIITQENYPALSASLLDYVKAVFAGQILPMTGSEPLGIMRIAIIVVFVMLPACIAVFAGIWGIVGNARQMVTGIGSIVNVLLGIGLIYEKNYMWIITAQQEVNFYMGFFLQASVTMIAAVIGILSLCIRPKVHTEAEEAIPELKEMVQEKKQPEYRVVQESIQPETARKHGTLVGLEGMYKGAEIQLMDGQQLKMGRSNENDLIFSDQVHVSRKHCVLIWHEARQQYSFYDTSSTGTYLNGTEDTVPQNMEVVLEPGCTLALGDETNIFRLE